MISTVPCRLDLKFLNSCWTGLWMSDHDDNEKSVPIFAGRLLKVCGNSHQW